MSALLHLLRQPLQQQGYRSLVASKPCSRHIVIIRKWGRFNGQRTLITSSKWDDDSLTHSTALVEGRRPLTDQKPKLSEINQSLPFLNWSYRVNLACSIAQLFEEDGVKCLLWGDMLHWIHGGEPTLPHEYSYVVEDKNLLNAHDILEKAGFKRCNLHKCYLNYKDSDAPAAHYHIKRPFTSWPQYTEFRGEEVLLDPDPEFEELETIRLYRLEETLWEIESLDMEAQYGGWPNNDVQDAGGDDAFRKKSTEEIRWPPGWPLTRIPTPQRYIEALLLHWVRYKDTEKELCWFFKLFDLIASRFYGYHTLNRMERHCRHIMESLLDHVELDDDGRFHTGVIKRDILLQAEKLLWKRAAGPLRHDPLGSEYRKARLMPARFPTGDPYCWNTEKRPWNTENHSWRQEVILDAGDEVGSRSGAEIASSSGGAMGSK